MFRQTGIGSIGSIGSIALALALTPAIAQAAPQNGSEGTHGAGVEQRSETGTDHAGGAERQGPAPEGQTRRTEGEARGSEGEAHGSEGETRRTEAGAHGGEGDAHTTAREGHGSGGQANKARGESRSSDGKGVEGKGKGDRGGKGSDRAGGGHGEAGKSGQDHGRGRKDHGEGHTMPGKCTIHDVAYVAAGTLVSDTVERVAGNDTYSGQITVEVDRTNEHARAARGEVETYRLGGVRIGGPLAVTALVKGDWVKVIGKVGVVAPKCEPTTAPTVDIHRLVLHGRRHAHK
ncbi:MAG: hypothetical protein ACYCUM_06920 [Solirubrobacteraceae bacterium]